jgi:hypothetical protein
MVTFSIPITLQTFTIAFEAPKMSFNIKVGSLNPINTLSGIFQRLQTLGFIDISAKPDSLNIGQIRKALRDFKSTLQVSPSAGGPSSAPPSGSAAPPGGTDPPDSDAASTADDRVTTEDDAGLSDNGQLDEATAALLRTAYGF